MNEVLMLNYGHVEPGDLLGMNRHGEPAGLSQAVTRWAPVAATEGPGEGNCWQRVTLDSGRTMTAATWRQVVVQRTGGTF